MLTTSEVAVTAAIWGLTAAGGFFGTPGGPAEKEVEG